MISRWDGVYGTCGSVPAGNDRNERYPTFPTIALKPKQAIFTGFGRAGLCMEDGIRRGDLGSAGNN